MGDWPAPDPTYELLKLVLAQNDKMLDMLSRSMPVDVIKALNPPLPVSKDVPVPWAEDVSVSRPLDPWSDEAIPDEEAIHGAVGGWVDVPGLEEAKQESAALGGVQEGVVADGDPV